MFATPGCCRAAMKPLEVRVMINDTLEAVVHSNGPDHLCVIFYQDAKRIGSFCAEHGGSRTDYMPEYRTQNGKSDYGVTFEQAVKLAMERR